MSLPDPATLPECGPSWAWWTNLHPYALAWRCTAEQSGSPELSASNIACAGTWLAPRLSITNLVAELYAGQLDAGADLDVATRRLRAHLRSDFDPKRVVHLLGESARPWLDQFTWKSAPRAEGRLTLTLPSWTNQRVHQAFDAQHGSVRMLASPSTCAQFTPRTERCVMDDRPPGFRWLGLHGDGSVSTRVGWLPHIVGAPREENESRS